MTIILFLVDTSASMSQRTYLGARPTLLDVAKDSIEKFLKLRQRDPASRGDRYMLLTFEDPPFNVKAGWKEHHNVFMTELKNLTASGMTTLGPSLKHSFDLLNLNRMQTGIDTYGHGRCPFYLEPSVIIVITDGGKLSNSGGIQDELSLPMHSSVPGSELTKEPFRWDQRLFALVLRLTGTVPADQYLASGPASDDSPIDGMCSVTGGRSYCVTSQRSLLQCLDSVVQKIQGGVVIHFEKVGPDPLPITPEESSEATNGDKENVTTGSLLSGVLSRASLLSEGSQDSGSDPLPLATNGDNLNGDSKNWTSCRKLIYVQRSAQKGYSVGHWPIPESFWPDVNSPCLPPRTAHPLVKFSCTDTVPMVIENLPFDKYELEPSALTRVILSRKAPHVAWQCFVSNSCKAGSDLGLPFGYLKASSNMTCVNLFVLPYDYPKLLPLLDELIKISNSSHNCKPSREWKTKFDHYIQNLPLYYAPPLKRALQRMGLPTAIVPDNLEIVLNYSVMNYLKRVKNQAKAEFDKMVGSVGYPLVKSTLGVPEAIRVVNTPKTKKISEMALVGNLSHTRYSSIKSELNEFQGFHARIRDKYSDITKSQSYRNAYDINRHELMDQIQRMRMNFLLPPTLIRLQDEDQMHSLPVAQMGNYQEYLKRIPPPLRELESAPVRQHMFGNPFKIDKKGLNAIIDEADVDLLNENGSSERMGSQPKSPKRSISPNPNLNNNSTGPNRNKRRPGPIPKDMTYRPSSPTPPSSPTNSNSSSPDTPSSDQTSSSDVDMSDVTMIESNTLSTEPFNHHESLSPDESFERPDGDVNKSSEVLISMTPSESENEDSEPSELMEGDQKIVTRDSHLTNNSDAEKDSCDSNESNGGDETEIDEVYSLVRKENHNIPVEYLPDTNGKIGRSQSFNYANYANGTSAKIDEDPLTSTSDSKNHLYLNGDGSHMTRMNLTPEEARIKRELITIAKRPGKSCYKELSDRLESISESAFRDHLLFEVKNAARRFKRKQLIQYLNQHSSHPTKNRHNSYSTFSGINSSLSSGTSHKPSSHPTPGSTFHDPKHHQKFTRTSMLKDFADTS